MELKKGAEAKNKYSASQWKYLDRAGAGQAPDSCRTSAGQALDKDWVVAGQAPGKRQGGAYNFGLPDLELVEYSLDWGLQSGALQSRLPDLDSTAGLQSGGL